MSLNKNAPVTITTRKISSTSKISRSRILIFSMGIALSMLFSSCAVSQKYNNDVVAAPKAVYHSLRLKINVTYTRTREKQGFKILLKFDDNLDKMLFLSPVNQVYGILWVDDEHALFINNRKKKYWEGPFHLLLQEMWGMDFNYQEFKQMIVDRELPGKERLAKQHIKVEFNSGQKGENIHITAPEVKVRVTLSNQKSRPGQLFFSNRNTQGLKKTALRELLTSD